MSELKKIISCMDDYDPDAMTVERTREVIRALIQPIAVNERVAVRAALGRVLGEDIISTMNVPAHDNSAMDGYALRGADLQPGDTIFIDGPERAVVRRESLRPRMFWLEGDLDLRRTELKELGSNRYQVIELIRGDNYSVRDLAQRMLALAHEYPEYRESAAAVRILDTTADDYYGSGYQDVQNRVPKIDNTRAELDWAPTVGMDDALRRIFDAYRGHVADARALVE